MFWLWKYFDFLGTNTVFASSRFRQKKESRANWKWWKSNIFWRDSLEHTQLSFESCLYRDRTLTCTFFCSSNGWCQTVVKRHLITSPRCFIMHKSRGLTMQCCQLMHANCKEGIPFILWIFQINFWSWQHIKCCLLNKMSPFPKMPSFSTIFFFFINNRTWINQIERLGEGCTPPVTSKECQWTGSCSQEFLKGVWLNWLHQKKNNYHPLIGKQFTTSQASSPLNEASVSLCNLMATAQQFVILNGTHGHKHTSALLIFLLALLSLVYKWNGTK